MTDKSAPLRFLRSALGVALPVLLFILASEPSLAGSATWDLNPVDSNWYNPANWTPQTVPNGPTDVATFGASNITGVNISFQPPIDSVGSIVFDPGASPFNLMFVATNVIPQFTFFGQGIVNNSGITQSFVLAASTNRFANVAFSNSSSAGDQVQFTLEGTPGGNSQAATIFFSGTATAGTASFSVEGGTGNGSDGDSYLRNGSTADNVNITVNAGPADALSSSGTGGLITFSGSATGGGAIFTNHGGTVAGAGGGMVTFLDTSSAGNATFINEDAAVSGAFAGMLQFFGDSSGDSARVKVFGAGQLNIGGHNRPGVTIGSLEGNGIVLLGANNLSVGGNDRPTIFSGVLRDDGSGGSLTKLGNGTLTLTGANTYSGGTFVSGGTLSVKGRLGSATGSGPVQVTTGTLSGKGEIDGPVTVGTGSSAATLAPGGRGRTGQLSIGKSLIFNSLATCEVELNSARISSDQVVANGATINSGAQISLDDLGAGTLTTGTVFTIISNAAATPIAGTFSNLADGATIIIGSNTYQVSYEGGDGNDLTLTVQ